MELTVILIYINLSLKMATKMKLFHDPLSQPSRAVMLLLEANKIDYNLSIIRVYKGLIKCNGIHLYILSWRLVYITDHLLPIIVNEHYFLAGDSYSDKDFRSVSAPHTVPTIDDNGFHLFERYYNYIIL